MIQYRFMVNVISRMDREKVEDFLRSLGVTYSVEPENRGLGNMAPGSLLRVNVSSDKYFRPMVIRHGIDNLSPTIHAVLTWTKIPDEVREYILLTDGEEPC